jgi:hypothetical protein
MANVIFSVANFVALGGWVVLGAFPRQRWVELVTGSLLPALLAGAYMAIIAATWGRTPGGFSSLAAVGELFESPWLRLAGWLHYLAFDLLIGGFIVRDARERGIGHGFILPLLFLTFMFGPAGWLGYRVLAAGFGRGKAPEAAR